MNTNNNSMGSRRPEAGSPFLVSTIGADGKTLFLVDRKICKSKWWSDGISDAMHFNFLSAAQFSCSRLKFNDPKVLTFKQALDAEKNNKLL